MIELNEKLEFFRFLGTQRAILLLGQKIRNATFSRDGRFEGRKLLRPRCLGDEFYNFFVWLHDGRLRD